MTEQRCRCWKPSDPQTDCPLHGTLAAAERARRTRAALDANADQDLALAEEGVLSGSSVDA